MNEQNTQNYSNYINVYQEQLKNQNSLPELKESDKIVNGNETHSSKEEESENEDRAENYRVNSPTHHHKMTHASDNFFPQNSKNDEKRDKPKTSASSMPDADKANSHLQ